MEENIKITKKEIKRAIEDITKKWEMGIKLFPFEKIIICLFYNLCITKDELKEIKEKK